MKADVGLHRRSQARAIVIVAAALIAAAGPALAQTPPAASPPTTATPPAATPPAPPPCPNQPTMQFTAWTSTLGERFGEGAREYIFADGYFCPTTDQDFAKFLAANPPKSPNTIVVLNSGGGDVDASLRMGELIRKAKMWTEVGSQYPTLIPQNENISAQTVHYISEPASPPFPGVCYSACTLTFMGGVTRTVGFGSNYGVHQFESVTVTASTDPVKATQGQLSEFLNALQSNDEKTAARLVAYLKDMGVSSDWIVQMVKKRGSDPLTDITNLTMKEMQDLRVVTPQWKTGWQITPLNDNSGFFLNGTSVDPWGTHQVAFVCAPKPAASAQDTMPAALAAGQPAPPSTAQNPPPPQNPPAPKLVLIALFELDPGTRAKAADIVNAVVGYRLAENGEVTPLIPAKDLPATVSGTRLSVILPITDALLPILEISPAIGITFVFDPDAKLPMRLLKFNADLDSAMLKSYAATCH